MNQTGVSGALGFGTSRVSALLLATAALLHLATPAFAAREVKFKEFPIELSATDTTKPSRLYVMGMRGSVRLISAVSGKAPVVRARKVQPDGARNESADTFESFSYAVRKEGSVLVIEPKVGSTQSDWLTGIEPGQPELHLEIEAPSVPTEIHLHTGSVQSIGWKAPITASVQDGSIKMSEGEGLLALSVFKGEVRVEKWKGRVQVESHAAKVITQTIDGDVLVNNFSGESALTAIKGHSTLKAKTGGSVVTKLEGGLEFLNGRGGLAATQVQGVVRGQTDDGAVSLALGTEGKEAQGESDVVVESQDGSVSIKPPVGSGALLRLSTDEGTLLAPESIAIPRGSGPKSVSARLAGTTRGTIVVRSKRGVIRIR
jgi:hypothetical protein